MRGADDLRSGGSGLIPSRTPSRTPPRRALSLSRALSKFGACSRAEAALRIAAGRVEVDGLTVLDPAFRIDPRKDQVSLDGHLLADIEGPLVIAYHKPKGLLTTRVDPGGRPTIYEALHDLPGWVFPAGRLDRDTSGLLILTNDHRLGDRLTDPRYHVPKTYHALLRGAPDEGALRVLREGVPIGDPTPTRPAQVGPLGARRGGDTWLEIVLTEGRNRQVRRMCAVVGHDVLELVRVGIGSVRLGDLPLGAWRELKAAELERLVQR